MTIRTLLALTAGVLLAADDAKDAARKELEKLRGTWVLVSAQHDGKKLPAEEVKKTRITIDGEKFVFPAASGIGTSQKGVIKVYPDRAPQWMDSEASDAAAKGKVSLGIYEVKGDDYRVCFAPPGKERPREFASPAGSGHILQVWKRKKE
jgi:uncharacterized protein (TIGR03067 family)